MCVCVCVCVCVCTCAFEMGMRGGGGELSDVSMGRFLSICSPCLCRENIPCMYCLPLLNVARFELLRIFDEKL